MKSLLPMMLCLFLAQWGNAVCTASFSYDVTNTTVTFTDNSTSTSGPIVSWFWDFDDGGTSNQQNPVHNFAGGGGDHFDVNLTITTANGCTNTVEIRVFICDLTIQVNPGDCDGDGNVPLNITVNDLWDLADEINIFVDGVIIPGGPFEIEDDEPVMITHLIEGDGGVHTISAQSIEIGDCETTVDVTVPNCGGSGPACFLTNLTVNFSGGATTTVNVGPGGNNSFSPAQVTITIGDIVHFVWLDGGHTSTSDATSGPDSWSTGEMNIGFTYDVKLKNPGLHRYYCVPHGGPNGSGMAGSIVANCPAGNNFTLALAFNATQTNPAGYNVLIDGVVQPGSPHQYSGVGPQTVTAALAGDGATHEFKIQDVADPTCYITRSFLAPDCGAAPQCNLTVTAAQGGGCNSSNQVPVNVTVVDVNGGTTFTVQVDGVAAGSFSYNPSGTTTVSVNVPGNGQSHTITVIDNQTTTCTGSTTITTPDCAAPCSITGLTATTGTSQTHVVQVQDFQFSPQHITITAGDLVEWQWTGAVQHTTTSDATSGTNSWNSGLLGTGATFTSPTLASGLHPYYCVPHGAPGGVGMAGTVTVQANCTNGEVAVAISFTAANGGFSGYNILVDGVVVPGGPFPYGPGGVTTNTVNVAGDGQSHTITVRDATTTTCQATTTIVTPDCNPATCELSLTAVQNGPCNSQNMVPVQLTVTDIAGGANFTVKVDGVTVGTFPYGPAGTTVVSVDVIGDGQSHTIVVTDATTTTCTATATVTTTLCNTPCSITGLSASTGTSQTHVVLVQDFNFSPQHITITAGDVVEWQWTGAVQHTSTSDAASGPNSWSSGLLGTGATFTSPVLAAGLHPYYCVPHGAPGGIGMAGTVTVQANCTNGEVPVTLTFTAAGGSTSGFNVLVDGVTVPGGPFPYATSGATTITVNVVGNGQSHTITVRDAGTPTCEATTTIVTPDCNASGCQLTAAATQNGGCNGQNQVPVQLTVTDVGGGANFTVKVDGVTVGTFPYNSSGTTVVSINVIGDGQNHTITVTDDADATCTASATVTTTNCSAPCAITGLTATSGTSQTHVVLVQDFVFSPQNITITAGDVVEWQWTGAVQHTSTSDATGANSWNSGLLGTGATYTSPVLPTGNHPYYCQPHGAPGGVGMAGSITVQANCTNGEVAVAISFTATGGSFSGYNILIDGNLVPGGPFPYATSGATTNSVNVVGDGLSHTITVRDAANTTCQASVDITTPNCNPPTCELFVDAVQNGSCNGQNMVPVQLTVTDVAGGANFTVKVDGVTVGTYPYGPNGTTVVTVSVIGDGQSHTITVTDGTDPNCVGTDNVVTTLCNTPCSITGLSASTGTSQTHVVLVQDFNFSPQNITITAGDVVEWQWTGAVQHTSTSDAASGPNSWSSGLLGTGATFTSPVLAAGLHPYYCVPHGAPGGIGMAGTVTVQANCTNGEVPVTLTFTAAGGSTSGFNVLVDGVTVPGGPFPYATSGATTVTVNVVGNGQSHTITVRDAATPTCEATTTIVTPDCNASGCQLTAAATQNGGCNGQNQVPVQLTVTDVGGGANFTVKVDGVTVGTFPYNSSGTTVVSINVIGDGQSHTITVTDDADATCTASATVTTTNCSAPCAITGLTATSGTSQTHVVLVQDFVFSPQNVTITAGDVVEWQWTGAVQHTATSDAGSGPASWNSGLLGTGATFTSPVLPTGNHPYYCQPHGAPGGVGMAGTITVQANCTNGEVAVAISFTATGGSFTGYNILIDGNLVPGGPFPYANSGATTNSVNVVGDGLSHTITVRDAANTTCQASVDITTPNCNPPACELLLDAVQDGPCNNQNMVPVKLTVTDVAGGANFTVKVDGVTVGTYPYGPIGTTVVTVSVIGDGQSHTITVTDGTDPNCVGTDNVVTTLCNTPCSITGLSASTGTSQTHVVLVEDFEFTPENITITAGDVVEWQWTGAVQHTATSDAASGPNSWNSGLLGTGATYTSPVLAAGLHPYYCVPHGAPGGIGMAGSITVQANCTNGQVAVAISFTAAGGSSAGYHVLVDGVQVPGGPFPYATSGATTISVNVPGNGQSHTITVRDAANATCEATTTITTPNCNASSCQLTVAAVQNGSCNGQNQVPVQVTVTDIGGGSNFTVKVDGTVAGTFNYSASGPTVVTVNVPGNGQSHTIVVTDGADPACTASTSVTTTNCSLPCQLSNLTLSTGGSASPTTHTVEVKDFEFSPKDITVTIGDVVHFQWTGAIQHTATSDATSGPVTFDSGLLGQGASYDVTIAEGGLHRYYCVPHGAPGGIGMAGTITANPPCTNGQVAVTGAFTSTNGGSGYNVYVDGALSGNNPHAYAPSGSNTFTVNVPGNGQAHTVLVQDASNAGCNVTGNITTPNCGGGGNPGGSCSLALAAVATSPCDSNNQVGIQLTVTGANTGVSGFMVRVDGNLYPGSPFPYNGSGTTVLNLLVSGTGQNRTFTVRDAVDSTCQATATVMTPLCGPTCEILKLKSGKGPFRHIVEVRDFDFFPDSMTVVVGDTVRFLWTGIIPHTSTSDLVSGPGSWNSGLLGVGSFYDVVITTPGQHGYYCIPHGGPNGIGMAGEIVAKDTCNLNGTSNVTVAFEVTNGSPLGYKVFVDGQPVPGNPTYQYQDRTGYNTVVVPVPGNGQTHLITVQDRDINYCAATAPFQSRTCPVICLVENLQVSAGGSAVHTVEVRDFDFFPQNLTVHTGEIVRFVWTGVIPHTTTSDALNGPNSWNSGILGQGSTYEVTIDEPGDHGYYCIPHGGPNGIGMAGTITAVEDCSGGLVGAAIQFSVTSGSPLGYRVFVDGQLYPGSPFPYDDPVGVNNRVISIPGDGQTHLITVQDMEVNFCAATAQLQAPDCNAACSITGVTATLPGPATHTVEVKDFNFAPANLTVNPGDVVHFVWTGAIAHTTTSDAASGPDSWDSGLLGQGAIYDVTLQTPGAHPYYCVPHGAPGGIGMAGTITVANAPAGGVVATVTFQATGTGNGGFNVLVDGVAIPGSPFPYAGGPSQTVSVSLPGDGLSHTIRIVDAADAQCFGETQITVPNLGTSCNLMATAAANGACNGANQVPYVLTVQSANTGSGFNVKVDGVTVTGSPFGYHASGTTTVDLLIAGDGLAHQIQVTDADSASCQSQVQVTTVDCTPTCTLGVAAVQNGQCDAGGQVSYTVTVSAANGSAAGFNLLLDGAALPGNPHAYAGATTTLNVLLPGDGQSHALVAADAATAGCGDTVAVQPPDCAAACAITAVSATIPGPATHTVEVKDFSFAPQTVTVNPGDVVHFVWTGAIAHTTTSDAASGPDSWDSGLLGQGATYDVSLTTPGSHPYYCIPHGAPGGIGMAGIIVVSNAPAGGVVATVTFQATGIGNGGYNVYVDGALAPGSPFPYLAGPAQTATVSLPGDGQSHTIRIVDAANAQCFGETQITTTDLGSDCSLTATAAPNGACNGANQVPYVLTVQSANTGSGFNVKVDGVTVTGSPFGYHASGTTAVNLLIAGDGLSHQILVTDADSAGCQAQIPVTTPDCTPTCSLSFTAAQNGTCNAADLVPYTVTVTSANGGSSGFNLTLDGNALPGNPHFYSGATTTFTVMLPGDGLTHTLIAADAATSACRDTVVLQTPDCDAGCTLDSLQVAADVPMVHIVEVRDFDYSPQDITVAVGDIVRFVWTGVVPHTATSDALTGPDSWNSGLLGQGAQYDVTIHTAGSHPYYCVPHGSPGGIGMAGTITAVEACDDHLLNVAFSFQSAGSFGAYTAKIDGQTVAGSPFTYGSGSVSGFNAPVDGDGEPHTVVIADVADPGCQLTSTFTTPDCDDPCFGFEAGFTVDVDHITREATFTNTSTAGGTFHLWTFGDGAASTQANPVHTYSENGTFQVCLITSGATCADTVCHDVTVGSFQCQASFTYEVEGLTVNVTNTSVTTEPITNITWSFGDNSQVTNLDSATHTWGTLGVFNLCLHIEAGSCVADTCIEIDRSNPCYLFIPDFAHTVDQSQLSVQFIDLTPGSPNQWLWGFGDGTTANTQSPEHFYDQAGNYNVCLLVQNTMLGCNASHCEVVNVGTVGTGSVEVHNRPMTIFPNPSEHDNTRWTVTGLQETEYNQTFDLVIYDVQGKTFHTGQVTGAKETALEVENPFPAGIYLVEMRSEKTTYRGRIIVQ